MAYHIKIERWLDAGVPCGSPHGYRADDYLPGYAEQRFDVLLDAYDWIDAHHKGPDVDGVTVEFGVQFLPVEA